MPSTLLNTVKAGSAALTNPLAPGAPSGLASALAPTTGEQTEQAAALTATAQTGKELGPATGGQARLSAVGEKLASMNTIMQAQSLQRQAGIQQTGLEQQEAAQQQDQVNQLAQVSQQRVAMNEDFTNKVAGILQDTNNQLANITQADDKSRAEQTGFMLRLSNTKYTDQLQNEATKSRLDNQVVFNEAMQKSIFTDETNLFSSSLEFRSMLSADQRSATAQMANINLDFAIQMSQTEAKGANITSMWSGVGTAIGAGASGAAAYATKSQQGAGGEAEEGESDETEGEE